MTFGKTDRKYKTHTKHPNLFLSLSLSLFLSFCNILGRTRIENSSKTTDDLKIHFCFFLFKIVEKKKKTEKKK